ncbi:MAG: hypothetical protein JOZ22_16695, partial [Acidobacteriia bacterium]|nr:hypothetical protein [Terriglobia bacterium]
MQFCIPAAAGLGAALLLLPALSAQQPASTATDSHPGSSATTTTVSAPPPAPAPSAAAAPDTKDPNAIRVQVNEVIVPVTVTDEKGRFVSDLDEKDFHIFEENKPQTIRYFTRERSQPVVIGFLLDLSTASRIHWKNFQAASSELVQNL